jgi:hypothetical protein
MMDAAEDVARENSTRLGDAKRSTRYEDLLEDPEVEAVIVASPTPLPSSLPGPPSVRTARDGPSG